MRLYITVLLFITSSCLCIKRGASPLITVIKLHSLEEDQELDYKGIEEIIDFESLMSDKN